MTAPLYVVVLPVSITLCILADRAPSLRPVYLCAVLCFGGLFPALDSDTPACLGSPTVIFTRDIVMRVSVLDTAYRQRTIETVALQPDGLEFRFTPLETKRVDFIGRERY